MDPVSGHKAKSLVEITRPLAEQLAHIDKLTLGAEDQDLIEKLIDIPVTDVCSNFFQDEACIYSPGSKDSAFEALENITAAMDNLSEALNKKQVKSDAVADVKNCVVSLLFGLCDVFTMSEDLHKKNADALFTKCFKCLRNLEDSVFDHKAICDFKDFLSNLTNCFSIVKAKITSLKKGSRKNAVQLHVLQLKKCLLLFMQILQTKRTNKEHPANCCSESEHYILLRVNCCLSELRANLENEGNSCEGVENARSHHRELVETACGQFLILVDEALSLLAIPMHEIVGERTHAVGSMGNTQVSLVNQKCSDHELCEELSPKVEKILCLSMSVSNVAVFTKDAKDILSCGQQAAPLGSDAFAAASLRYRRCVDYLLSGSYPSIYLAWVALPGAINIAPASTALGVIGTHKPFHHDKVLKDLQSLKDACASPVAKLYSKNQHASNLSEALFCLEQRVNTALLRLVVEVFDDPFASLLHLMEASTRPEGPRETRCSEDLEDLIATYDLHMDRMVQIGVFAISCSNDRKRIPGLRSCLASLESLEPELVPTAVSLYLNPLSESKASHLRFLAAHWRQEAGQLQFLLDGIVDPVAFCRVTYEEIHKLIGSIRKCVVTEGVAGPMVARVISRAQRMLSVLRHEGSDFLKGQSILISDLEFGIAECRAAHKAAFQGNNMSPQTDGESHKNRVRVVQRCLLIASLLRKLEAQMSEQSAVLSVCSIRGFDQSSTGSGEWSPYRIGERSVLLPSLVVDGEVGVVGLQEPSADQ